MLMAMAERLHVEPEYKRSGRCMSRMDDETRVVHARLEEWSSEAKGAFRALGLPSQSFCERWAVLEVRTDPGHEAQMSDRAFNVDRAVRKLGEIDRSVIWRYYMDFRPGDALWRKLHAIEGLDHFNRVLRRARWRVSGFLAALE